MNHPHMKLWAIVPVKPFDEGKSRLADALSPDKRRMISRRLFLHVMGVIQDSTICQEILVVSRSEEVLTAAEKFGAISLREKPAPSTQEKFRATSPRVAPLTVQVVQNFPDELVRADPLNLALEQARTHAVEHYADALLVIPADLPLITPTDLRNLKKVASWAPGIVVAPSNDGGTNALLLNPPSIIDFAFGIHSFQRHRDQAALAGVPSHVFESPNLATDIDHPYDLDPIREWL